MTVDLKLNISIFLTASRFRNKGGHEACFNGWQMHINSLKFYYSVTQNIRNDEIRSSEYFFIAREIKLLLGNCLADKGKRGPGIQMKPLRGRGRVN